MSTILKEGVLHEKNMDASGREKVDKIMDTITEAQEISAQNQIKNPESKTLSSSKPVEKHLEHSVFSNEVLIEGENATDLHEIRNRLKKELNPANEMELIIVDRIVSSIWRLKRCLKIESQILEYSASCIHEYEQGFLRVRKRTNKEMLQLKALKIIEDKKRIEDLSGYETLLERQIYKALGELDKLRRRGSVHERKVLRRSK
jgi:hypothetical protein